MPSHRREKFDGAVATECEERGKNTVIDSPPISPMPKVTATRLGLAVEVLLHTFDHYGQMVEYLRMNGLVPPPAVWTPEAVEEFSSGNLTKQIAAAQVPETCAA